MKVFALFVICFLGHATALLPAVLSTGASTQYRTQDNIGNYAFGYDEGHLSGGTFRKESGDVHGNKIGSYGLRDADGRIRIVNYVADAAGFRADIKTNEPGVEPKDPANTSINKAGLIVAPAHHTVAYAAAPFAHATAPFAHAQIAYAARPVTYNFRQYPTLAGHYGYYW